MSPRVVVTGAGVISPIGAGIDAFAEALWSGASGIAPSQRYPGSAIAEFTDFNPTALAGQQRRSGARPRHAPPVRGRSDGAELDCVSCRMRPGEGDPDLGLVCGTMFGGVHSIAAFDWSGLTEGPTFVSPMEFPNTVINAPAGQAAIKHKLRGVNSTICAGLASGLYAIQYAAEFLRFGRARYLMAGGMEEVCDEAALGFQKLGIASPAGVARPFGYGSRRDRAGRGRPRSGCWKPKRRRARAA